jgi:hypothetical protein
MDRYRQYTFCNWKLLEFMPWFWRQIVRDVSDEDGLVGKFQANVHEVGRVFACTCWWSLTWWRQVSGKQVVDANKYALQVSS